MSKTRAADQLKTSDLEKILEALNAESGEILLSMVVSSDGLLFCSRGQGDDLDASGAYCIELKLICDKALEGLRIGPVEHLFVRGRYGCVDLWPIDELGVLACMARPEIRTGKLQMVAWRAVSGLREIMREMQD